MKKIAYLLTLIMLLVPLAGCAGDENEMRFRKSGEEVAGTVQKDSAVGVGTAPAGRGGEDDGSWRFNPCSEMFDLGGVREVAGKCTVVTRPGESGDVPTHSRSLPGDFLAEVTVASDEKVAIHLANS